MTHPPHPHVHKSQRAAWLRAAVLGADDGIVSVSSIMVGVLAAAQSASAIMTAGIAGLVAGALSMAAGEYVSVSSQRDSEISDIEVEKRSIQQDPSFELHELASIYVERGLTPELAREVALQLHSKDPLRAHARDELGIDYDRLARPVQAAFASAISFAVGGAIPIIAALAAGTGASLWSIVIVSLVALAVSGSVGAAIGGGKKVRAALRVFIGGGFAMLITFLIGHLVGGVV